MEVLSEAWPWKVFPTSGKEFKRYPPTPVPSCRIYYMDSHSHNPLQILVELMEFSLISQINKEKESLSLGIMIQETVLAYWIIPPGHRGSSGCASVYCHGRLHGRKVEILPGYCQWRSIVQPRKEGRRTFARRRSKCASSFKDHGSRGLQLLLAADACCIFMIGVKNETMKSGIPLHSPYIVLDERVLPVGAALHAAVAISYLDRQSVRSN